MTSTTTYTDSQSAFAGTAGALTGIGILTLALAPLAIPFLVLTLVFLAPLALPGLLLLPLALVALAVRGGRRLLGRRRAGRERAAGSPKARPASGSRRLASGPH